MVKKKMTTIMKILFSIFNFTNSWNIEYVSFANVLSSSLILYRIPISIL